MSHAVIQRSASHVRRLVRGPCPWPSALVVSARVIPYGRSFWPANLPGLRLIAFVGGALDFANDPPRHVAAVVEEVSRAIQERCGMAL